MTHALRETLSNFLYLVGNKIFFLGDVISPHSEVWDVQDDCCDPSRVCD
jgi:hypothetical protein